MVLMSWFVYTNIERVSCTAYLLHILGRRAVPKALCRKMARHETGTQLSDSDSLQKIFFRNVPNLLEKCEYAILAKSAWIGLPCLPRPSTRSRQKRAFSAIASGLRIGTMLPLISSSTRSHDPVFGVRMTGRPHAIASNAVRAIPSSNEGKIKRSALRSRSASKFGGSVLLHSIGRSL